MGKKVACPVQEVARRPLSEAVFVSDLGLCFYFAKLTMIITTVCFIDTFPCLVLPEASVMNICIVYLRCFTGIISWPG